jgi:hypothetical protein
MTVSDTEAHLRGMRAISRYALSMPTLPRVILASAAVLLLGVLTGCASGGAAPGSQPKPKSTPMSGVVQAGGYYLDIICPVIAMQNSQRKDVPPIDELHTVAKTEQSTWLHAADLFKDPGAAWPAKVQKSIDVETEYATRYADFWEKVTTVKTITEMQGFQRPSSDKAFDVKFEEAGSDIRQQLQLPEPLDCTGHGS